MTEEEKIVIAEEEEIREKVREKHREERKRKNHWFVITIFLLGLVWFIFKS
ncbi:MAG: hypothetical protein U9Q90_08475 [Campylobacterota bacterium]|nr:hypothetical protein [Campylobacterota bacterium]